jgi:hypothetical protein
MKQFKPFKHKKVVDLKDMQIYDYATHGDLSICKIEETDLPADFDSLEDVDFGVLAEGEAHAHAHQLFDNVADETSTPAFQILEGGQNKAVNYTLKKSPEGFMFLKVEGEPLLLKHQTHNPFRIHKGLYDIDFQVEKDHLEEQLRRVLD